MYETETDVRDTTELTFLYDYIISVNMMFSEWPFSADNLYVW